MFILGTRSKKMKIGIILNPYGEDKPAGLGRSVYEMTRAILEIDKKNEYLIILRKRPKTLPNFPGNNWKIKIADYRYFWLDIALFGEKLDICIFNTPVISLFVRPVKSIVVTFDYAYDDFGKNNLLKLYHKFSLKMADHIIAISEATKRETVRLFNIPQSKISIAYLGFNNICSTEPTVIKNLPDKFFMFAGIIKERKNVIGVVKGFAIAKKKFNLLHKLVIAGSGKGKYFEDILNYIEENGLIDEIVFAGHANDGMLSYLYGKAEALIFPSFVEGFGMPVLEAMGCGTPVITSNLSSLPEVAGDAAILVNPHDPEDIAIGIGKLALDHNLRSELSKKGFEQIKKFTWESSAREILSTFD